MLMDILTIYICLVAICDFSAVDSRVPDPARSEIAKILERFTDSIYWGNRIWYVYGAKK